MPHQFNGLLERHVRALASLLPELVEWGLDLGSDNAFAFSCMPCWVSIS